MGFGKARTLLTYNDKVECDDDFSSDSNKPLRKYSSSAAQSVKIPCASFPGDTETRHRIWEIPENSLLAPHLSPLQPVKRLRSRWSSKTCCKPCLRARATTQGSSGRKKLRVIGSPLLETALTLARPLRGDKNSNAMALMGSQRRKF